MKRLLAYGIFLSCSQFVANANPSGGFTITEMEHGFTTKTRLNWIHADDGLYGIRVNEYSPIFDFKSLSIGNREFSIAGPDSDIPRGKYIDFFWNWSWNGGTSTGFRYTVRFESFLILAAMLITAVAIVVFVWKRKINQRQ